MENLTEIIEGCKRKDPLSQEKLYRYFYPALYTLCKTFFSEKHDIITALNNGMLRAFYQYSSVRSRKGTALYLAVHNRQECRFNVYP